MHIYISIYREKLSLNVTVRVETTNVLSSDTVRLVIRKLIRRIRIPSSISITDTVVDCMNRQISDFYQFPLVTAEFSITIEKEKKSTAYNFTTQ